jgi:hypothetical protein
MAPNLSLRVVLIAMLDVRILAEHAPQLVNHILFHIAEVTTHPPWLLPTRAQTAAAALNTATVELAVPCPGVANLTQCFTKHLNHGTSQGHACITTSLLELRLPQSKRSFTLDGTP